MTLIHHTSPAWKILSDGLTVSDQDGFEVASTHASVATLGLDQARMNAQLIAAAPELKAIVESACNAFRERLSCLQDELRDEWSDRNDIRDQIGHYAYLLKEAKAVFARTEGKK